MLKSLHILYANEQSWPTDVTGEWLKQLQEGLQNHQATLRIHTLKLILEKNIYIMLQGKLVTDQSLQTEFFPSEINPEVTK